MNTLKEVPHPSAIEHAIEVLKSCFDHPEADEAIAGLTLLREQLKWAQPTPQASQPEPYIVQSKEAVIAIKEFLL